MSTTVDLSEKAFLASVLDLAQRFGWKTAHFHSTIRHVRKKDGSYATVGDKAAAGFPDLVLVKGDRLIFAELKREKTRLTSEQHEWLEALGSVRDKAWGGMWDWDAPPETYVWRPSMWDEVEAILKGELPAFRSTAHE